MYLTSVAFAAATLLLAQRSTAQTPFYEGELYISPVNNNEKCLQTSNYNGAPVVLADCAINGSEDQRFTFNGGAVTLYGGQKCLYVTDGNNTNGVKLQVWDCNSSDQNQQWYWTMDNHLAWTNHGRCMDLTDGSMANGNSIQIWDCSGDDPDQWWNVGYMFNQLPNQSQNDQTGNNSCGADSSSGSGCQTLCMASSSV
jgi:hypothetical protein